MLKRWILRIAAFLLLIIFLLSAYLFIPVKVKSSQEITWGVTFTKSYAQYLGLDWKKVYLAALDDLKVKAVRLGINWDEVELSPGKFDFSDYDWMFQEASKRGVEVLPVIGFKLPRWPECRSPQWVKNLSEEKFKEAQLAIIKAEVEHFKKYSNVKMWQLENEVFIGWFGDCPPPDDALTREKIDLLRRLDPSRPVMMTESGELATWLKSAAAADVLGISIYRRTWNELYGYSNYHLPASYYVRKAKLIQAIRPVITRLWKNHNQVMTRTLPVIVTELQLEAWAPIGILNQPIDDQLNFMGPEQMQKNISFVRQAGFDTVYGWGVEWWWWLKENGYPALWQTAKEEFGK